MRTRIALALSLLLVSATGLWSQTAAAPTVRFHTNLGDMDVLMIPSSAPLTVANFLKYMNRGDYDNSIIHRSVRNFVIQGGGFKQAGRAEIKADPAVKNEFSLSNARGTLAMAKLGGNPDSATNQWFFNLGLNASLNSDNGGYTVFGRIINQAGLNIMDKIAAVPIWNTLPSPFDEIPLINYPGGGEPAAESYVTVISVSVLTPPTISQNGIVSVSNFGGFNYAAPGSFIEVYGTNLAGTIRGWGGDDFTNGIAPRSLDGVTALVDNTPAYVNYVSNGQVNLQVPANAREGLVPVSISYGGQTSVSVGLNIKPLAPGLLAPPAFKVGDKQYVAAFHSPSNTIVSSGNIPNTTAAPAIPGETLTFYGIGFGPVVPSSIPVAGRIAEGPSALSAPMQFKIGDNTAATPYAGLAPNFVGLYQFNVVVPANTPGGDQPVSVILNGETLPQTLFLSVKN